MTGRLANRAAYAKELARLALLCAVTCAAGVANYVLFFLIGQYMPKWPSFLNIGQSIISALGFVVWLWVRDRRLRGFLRSDPHRADVLRRELERPAQEKRRLLCHYLFLGVLMAANGVCVQTADTHVSGALQSFLGIVVVPAGGLMAWRFLGERFPPLRIAGSVTVLAGIAAAVVPPLFEDSPPPDSHGVNSADWNGVKWVLLYLGGMLPYAAQSVYEEKLFAAPLHADPLRALTWSTLITVPIYLLYMPIDAAMRGNLSEFIQEQGDAMRCFIGDIEAIRDSGCRPYAGLMLTVFSLEYVLLLWLLAVLVERESAVFQILVVTIMTPLSAATFAFRPIMGSFTETLGAGSVVALFVIPVGIAIYKYHDISLANRASAEGLLSETNRAKLDQEAKAAQQASGDRTASGEGSSNAVDIDGAVAALVAAARPTSAAPFSGGGGGRVPSTDYISLPERGTSHLAAAAAEGATSDED